MSSSSNAQHGSSNQQSDHATKRKEAVERILALPEDHYFEILDLPVTKESPKKADVIHAYRKISVLVHPDKISDDSLKPRFTDAFRRMLSFLLDFALTYIKADTYVQLCLRSSNCL